MKLLSQRNLLAVWVFLLIFVVCPINRAGAIDSNVKALLSRFKDKTIGFPKDALLYRSADDPSPRTLEEELSLQFPFIGLARCKGGLKSAAPIPLYESSLGHRVLHTIACSNFNDWIATEAESTGEGPFDKAAIILGSENGMFRVVLSPRLYQSAPTQKIALTFPVISPWSTFRSAWIKREFLSPLMSILPLRKAQLLKSLVAGAQELDDPETTVKDIFSIGHRIWFKIHIRVYGNPRDILQRDAMIPWLGPNGAPQIERYTDGMN